MIKITAQVHGRVNLIGDHTDYNGGWILPTAIPQTTTTLVTLRRDQEVHASSTATHLGGSAGTYYKLGQEKPTRNWIDYIQGATKILDDLGYKLGGFDIRIQSTIPLDMGLGSSAALEVSTIKSIKSAFKLGISEVDVPKIAHRIESDFVGSPNGIADQLVTNLVEPGQALYLDTMKMSHELIQLPMDKMDIAVIHSGLTHQHAAGDYNIRREECQEACELLGITSLREISVRDLYRIDSLPMALRRKARHVITENERVHMAVAAIRSGNIKKLGELFYESHLSQKEDYLVSLPEIDLLVELCREKKQVYGARLTGSGFGGAVVIVTEKGAAKDIARSVVDAYREKTPHRGSILVA